MQSACMNNPRGHQRRGVILIEAILGGAMLAVGLTVLISITSQAIAKQRLGEDQIIAAALIDEMLNRVLIDGPIDYPKANEMNGRFQPPFENFDFTLEIDDLGETEPFRVTVTVRWRTTGQLREAAVQTYIAPRRGGTDELREPGEPIYR